MCGIPISYKNTQLISQFTSPYSGQLFTQPRTGMCPKKYKELSVAHKIASDLLLIGPSKDPIFLTDPTIGRGLSSRYKKRNVQDALGTPFSRSSFIASEARIFASMGRQGGKALGVKDYAKLSAEDIWDEDREIEPDYIEDPEFAAFLSKMQLMDKKKIESEVKRQVYEDDILREENEKTAEQEHLSQLETKETKETPETENTEDEFTDEKLAQMLNMKSKESSDGVFDTSFDFMNQLTVDVMTEAQKLQAAREGKEAEEKRLAKKKTQKETQETQETETESTEKTVEIEKPAVSDKKAKKFAAKLAIRDRAARIRALREKSENAEKAVSESETVTETSENEKE